MIEKRLVWRQRSWQEVWLRLFLLPIAFLSGLLLSQSTATPPQVTAPRPLGLLVTVHEEPLTFPVTPLLPEFDWAGYFEQWSGHLPNPDQFGAYVTLPVSDTLYIGLGAARPAEEDGALVARFAGDGLSLIGPLDEQGVHEMAWDGQRLQIAGSDPCCDDDWSAGNQYVYTPGGGLRKYRDPVNGLTNVIHTWGLWTAPDGELYAATGAHAPEADDIYFGQIFRSDDAGISWEWLSNASGYRVYDIIGFEDQLFALTINALNDPPSFKTSTDGGRSWSLLLADTVQRIHFLAFQEQLLFVSFSRRTLFSWQGGALRAYHLPPNRRIGVSYDDSPSYANYNMLTTDGTYLYTVWEEWTEDGPTWYVVRTPDLVTWETLANTNHPFVSLTYWPSRHSLIAGEKGLAGQLWVIDLKATQQVFLPAFFQ